MRQTRALRSSISVVFGMFRCMFAPIGFQKSRAALFGLMEIGAGALPTHKTLDPL